MKKKTWIGLILGISLFGTLLSACQSGAGNGTQESVKPQSSAEATQSDGEDPQSEDFFGIWEYESSSEWLYIYGDGTYEWYTSEGLSHSGTYYIEGEELHLEDEDRYYGIDGEGNLVDSDGEKLFSSELPDTWEVPNEGDPEETDAEIDDPGVGDPGVGDSEVDDPGVGDPGDAEISGSISVEEFYGTWQNVDGSYWLVITDRDTWEMCYADGTRDYGTYSMIENGLFLDLLQETFVLKANGNIESEYGRELFPSELPDILADKTVDNFVGCWKYADTPVWIYVFPEGMYDWISEEDGINIIPGTCYADNNELILENGVRLFYNLNGQLMDNYGDMLQVSVPPEYYGSDPGQMQ